MSLSVALQQWDVCAKPPMPQNDKKDDKRKKQQIMAKPPPSAMTSTQEYLPRTPENELLDDRPFHTGRPGAPKDLSGRVLAKSCGFTMRHVEDNKLL